MMITIRSKISMVPIATTGYVISDASNRIVVHKCGYSQNINFLQNNNLMLRVYLPGILSSSSLEARHDIDCFSVEQPVHYHDNIIIIIILAAPGTMAVPLSSILIIGRAVVSLSPLWGSIMEC